MNTECQACHKELEIPCSVKPSESEFARHDYYGLFTGIYCHDCFHNDGKYRYRRDAYENDAIANGEKMEEEY